MISCRVITVNLAADQTILYLADVEPDSTLLCITELLKCAMLNAVGQVWHCTKRSPSEKSTRINRIWHDMFQCGVCILVEPESVIVDGELGYPGLDALLPVQLNRKRTGWPTSGR